ncbi:hypothetical protein J2S43_007878 [Catenuloplanes nepalensis]|uniref:Uncharacterized protein n=1 Tax=Catenuloplanes nepalensis TaxID=587533 RepID=A0ABT9N7F6_9ACTN|nr:hypothetical protein [Catenuloplanes nepalensis]MDP9799366.1 hypothetical protein [Catenuloplanes nepalensis]
MSAQAAVERARSRAGLAPTSDQTPTMPLPTPRSARDYEPEGLPDPVRWRRRVRQIRTELDGEAAPLGRPRRVRWPGCPCEHHPTSTEEIL